MNFLFAVFAILFALIGGVFMGAGMEYDHDRYETGVAFGCGRFYAGNFDPADDPRDDRSPCYPYYKAWDAQQWHPGQVR
jgi:hypothetical protein